MSAIVESGSKDVDARARILDLEAAMMDLPQLEIKTTHHFCNGVYAREIFIPKGTVLTGKIHKTEHLNIVSQGKIAVYTEEGMSEIEAPCTIVSKPGTKRVGFALEDTVWTTIHPTNETDLQKLEAELICTSFDLLEVDAAKKLEESL